MHFRGRILVFRKMRIDKTVLFCCPPAYSYCPSLLAFSFQFLCCFKFMPFLVESLFCGTAHFLSFCLVTLFFVLKLLMQRHWYFSLWIISFPCSSFIWFDFNILYRITFFSTFCLCLTSSLWTFSTSEDVQEWWSQCTCIYLLSFFLYYSCRYFSLERNVGC